MKCPECGAWTQVLQTYGAWRRRECANEHRFNTVETLTRVGRSSFQFKRDTSSSTKQNDHRAMNLPRKK